MASEAARATTLDMLGSASDISVTTQDKTENLHLTESIDTELLSIRGQSVWVHSSQVRLLDSSVPHSSLPEREGSVGTGEASKLGTESRLPFPVRI